MRRRLLALAGIVSLGVGALAAAVPLLPSFPFLLMAFICFGKSSKRLETWFLNSKLYKNNLEGYLKGRGLTKKAKARVIVTVTLVMGISFYFLKNLPWVRLILATVWLGHMVYFIFIVKNAEEKSPATDANCAGQGL